MTLEPVVVLWSDPAADQILLYCYATREFSVEM